MKKSIIFFIFLILSCSLVFAHQPRIAFDKEISFSNPIVVESPEISKAYYGELNGEPDYYRIESSEEFNLYLNILTPDLPDSRTDFIAEVIHNNETIILLDGTDQEWTAFFEPFARDNYLKGPEFEETISSGSYIIKISNKENSGRYSLAVGKIESFTPVETIKTFVYLPSIKKNFFEKSPLSAFTNIFTLFSLIIIVALISITFYIIKKLTNKKHEKKR